MKTLLEEISRCQLCSKHLPHGPRPIVSAEEQSRIVIIGQAPGAIVHKTGIPWNDKSGDNLRQWLGMSTEEFYDSKLTAIVPMGFCYPGKGASGDLPPRPECAPAWHEAVLGGLTNDKITLLIGQYAQRYYLKGRQARTLTETVRNYKSFLPEYFVLPHPSPRNNIWMAKNPWFKQEVLPELQQTVRKLL